MIEVNEGTTREVDSDAREEKDARNWAVLGHLSALLLLFGIPFGNILGPLVVWLFKRNDHPLVDEQCKEALNFQISMTLYFTAAAILLLIFGASLLPLFWPFHYHNYWDFWGPQLTMPFAFLSGAFLLVLLFILDIGLLLLAAFKASNGVHYRYPLTIRLVN
jgi:hypothetical protein